MSDSEKIERLEKQIQGLRAAIALQARDLAILRAKFEANAHFEAWVHGALMKAFPPIGEHMQKVSERFLAEIDKKDAPPEIKEICRDWISEIHERIVSTGGAPAPSQKTLN